MHFQPCRRHNGFTKMELMEEIPRYLEDDEYAKYLKENGYGHLQSPHGCAICYIWCLRGP